MTLKNMSSPVRTASESQLKSSPEYERAISETVEYARCAASPHYFLTKYAWIQNKITGRKVKWEPWPYQLDLLTILQTYLEVIIAKARQLGVTWTVTGGYGLWKTNFGTHSKAMYMSQGENEAQDMINKADFIHSNLPDFLQAEKPSTRKDKIDFPRQHSEIIALPSTDKAGQGTDATLIIRDELAFHPEGRKNFGMISPAIDAGGQIIDLSRVNKTDPTNHFTERVIKAYEGSTKTVFPSGLELYTKPNSKTCLVFLCWRLRPVRQEGMSLEEFYDLRLKPKYTKLELEENYPESFEHMMAVPSTEVFFDLEALQDMQLNITEPDPHIKEINTWGGLIKIWEKPRPDKKYVVFTDPADGYDPFCTVVMSVPAYEWVAIGHGVLKAEQSGEIHDSLVRWYNNAYNSGEVNARAGGKFELTLKDLKTPNIAPRRDMSGNIQMGKGNISLYLQWTADSGRGGNSGMRDLMLRNYEQAIRNQLITIHNKDAIDEHKDFIRFNGKLQARNGRHDDYVMAGAGAWLLQKYVHLTSATAMKSYEYRRA